MILLAPAASVEIFASVDVGSRRLLRPLLVALALWLAPALGNGQTTPSRGEEYTTAGVAAYRARRFHDAAIEFRAAYDLTRAPELLFNLGSAWLADGRPAEAREAFVAFLRALPDAPNRAAVEARLRELEPPPAAVPPAPAGTPPPAPPVVVAPRAPRLQGPSPWRWVGLAAGGVGLALGGVGAGLYVHAGAVYDRCVPGCARADQARGADTAGVALLWAGGVLAAAGATMVLVAPSRATPSSVQAWIVPIPGGVGVGGSF